jgi:SNF2 family DNA or RNA helicase
MGWEGFNSYKKILFFITREEFIEYFKEKKIPNKKWMSSSWLNRNKFSGLYDRIVKRFGTWERFLKFMDEEEIETEDEFDKISGLGIEESIALLQDDPLKLKRYLQFAHPELTEEEIDRLVQRSFKGLRSGKVEKNEDKYLLWEIDLDDVTFDEEIPRETKENTLTISGKSGEGSHMFVAGAYTRRKKVESDGSWSITIPLKVGEINEIRIMSLDRENELRSKQLCFDIAQEGEQDDILSLVQLLSELGAEVHRGIQENPGRFKYLCQTMEQSLIKKFGRSFADGEKYVQGIIEKEGISPSMRRVLKTVLKKFQSIHDAELPGVIEGSLLFFQKYCAYDIRRRMEEGLPGVILANDPGLGKTRTVQAATADRHTTVITPNSVVSSWEEESGRVMENTDGVLALHGLDHTIRKEMLRTRRSLRETLEEGEVHHTYLNREFLRKTTDTERFSLLSDSQTVVVHDEAHSRTIESSEQSKGAKMLEADFQLLVTATPFKNPVQFRRMMAVLKPDDVRFKSDKAFLKAFPAKDPDALKTLSLLKEEVTLRFRKEDVMETVDPGQSLDQQRHKLPMKTYIAPEERGAFTMSMDQAWSAYEMFVKWPTWCKKNNKYIPKDALATEDGLRTSNGFAKKHALRQTVNNPQYINSEAKDAKLEEMKKIVQSCLAEGRKIVIFCAYEAQVEKYAKEFAKLNPAIYSGATSKNGIRKDASGRNSKFKKGDAGDQSHGWILDGKGYPIPSVDGDCMSELDYERITFQNAPERQLMIATYDAGSVGTTFTAGKAMIFDDIPRDCVEEIQAEDRIHRIDPNRLTHSDVKYFHMKSAYPEEFLEATKKRWVVRDGSGYKEFFSVASAQKFAQANAKDEKEEEVHNAYTLFFAQGTYDEVQSANLVTQRIMFRLINDGIGDESLLKTNQMHFEGINGNGVKTLAV